MISKNIPTIGDQSFEIENYLNDKVKQKAIPVSFAQIAISSYTNNEDNKKLN